MPDPLSLPFITRKMLAFEEGVVFQLEIIGRSSDGDDIDIIGITKEGTFKFTFTPTSNGLKTTKTIGLTDIPIFVSAHTQGVEVLHGETYITMYLLANGERIMRLCSGYVDSGAGIGWPATQAEPSIPNRGHFVSKTGADQAAGEEILQTIPANEIWFMKGLFVTLVTSSTAANRRVHFKFQLHGNAKKLEVISPELQTASLTRNYHLLPYGAAQPTGTDNDICINLPPELILRDGSLIETETENFQVGDNFGTPGYIYEKFIASITD